MKIRTILTLGTLAIALALVSWWMGEQSYTWFPPQASAESQLIDRLFSFLVAIGTFIFLGVVGTIVYVVLFQQASKYDTSDGPHIEGNVTLEVVWTAIPFILVIGIAGYSYHIYDRISILGPMEHVHESMAHDMAPEAPAIAPVAAEANDNNAIAEPEVVIVVKSRQWAWEFYYPDRQITTTELHLPADQRISLQLTSEDVIHGFYIPAFRVKQDVIPGRAITLKFTPIREGRYRLRDSQYSGTYFAAMQADVVVESPDSYQQWLTNVATQTPTAAYNQAFDEFQRAPNGRIGWQTVQPAPPPLVNYPGKGTR
ncbi:cytochrome c oxidase subunit II [Limnothrix redekei]|uniref:Cytochrome c oxidase subunit 2 n=1 Tax=Limnothrix redekei LRLZ20PSL1 TaxID=3112953 RepID=A0ABW7CA17_9CYAN